MRELTRRLQIATELIGADFICLPVAGGDGTGTYQERIYCYELYHQLRLIWPQPCDFSLTGEVHKGGHPNQEVRQLNAVPDLLVHRPGHMDGNYAMFEVKRHSVSDAGIRDDLLKLQRFKAIRYERLIFLVFASTQWGNDDAWIDRIENIINENGITAKIEFWLHREAEQSAVCVRTFNNQQQA